MKKIEKYGVVILGAGLAGLSLCRHLRMSGYKGTILLLDNKARIPGKHQKVGESLVQVGGHYFSKVLDLEEHLYCNHLLKYNLRFYWKPSDETSSHFENYSQSYIRPFSNVCSYQLDRNVLEAHLLELNHKESGVKVCHPARALKVELSEEGLHNIRFKLEGEEVRVEAEWVVDTTGRGQYLKKKGKLDQGSPINHGSSWCWVEGLVDIEKLTDQPLQKIRVKADRRQQGWIPLWLATNHFMGEGFWFWVIPLQGITSLGLVYDKELIDDDSVATPEKLVEWACREFPLFQRDLPERKIVDGARFLTYSYDSRQTISPSKWAMSGMSGRFTDPLYSPGSDLISYYNTMIVDSILEADQGKLASKCEIYEALMQVVYEAYIPSYATSYDVLGDQEVFTLKYSWELAIYFAFYVFPFVNDFFTDETFIRCFFRKFAQLGPINRNLQKFLSDCFQWKKQNGLKGEKVLNDFFELTPLKETETAFYEVGITVDEAEDVLDYHLRSLKEFARYIYAYLSSVVLEDPSVLTNEAFVRKIKLKDFQFGPEAIRAHYDQHRACEETYEWHLDSQAMEKFRESVGLLAL